MKLKVNIKIHPIDTPQISSQLTVLKFHKFHKFWASKHPDWADSFEPGGTIGCSNKIEMIISLCVVDCCLLGEVPESHHFFAQVP